jgi:predicted aspartyl protease
VNVTFDAREGLIVVKVDLWGPKGGGGVVQLALDTGATTTTVNGGMLANLGYDPAGSSGRVPVTTGSGIAYAPLVVISKIVALGQERVDFPVLGHTLPPSAGVDGVLGLDFLRGLSVTLDFRAGQITVT